MKTKTNGYHGYRFPRETISHSVWLYHRFSLSFRDVEELLAKRGIVVIYENNRAEVSHQPTRQRERQMRGFKSAGQAQMFLSVHGVILNFFRFARHLMRAENYRLLRTRSFKEWSAATGT